QPTLVGNLRVSKMEVIGVQSNRMSELLTSNTPFNIRLTLDLTKFQVPDRTILNYKASIQGKERSGHANLLVAEAQGTIIPTDTAIVTVECPPLPEGFYRLAATVMVALPDAKLKVKPGATAVIGGMVQVY